MNIAFCQLRFKERKKERNSIRKEERSQKEIKQENRRPSATATHQSKQVISSSSRLQMKWELKCKLAPIYVTKQAFFKKFCCKTYPEAQYLICHYTHSKGLIYVKANKTAKRSKSGTANQMTQTKNGFRQKKQSRFFTLIKWIWRPCQEHQVPCPLSDWKAFCIKVLSLNSGRK